MKLNQKIAINLLHCKVLGTFLSLNIELLWKHYEGLSLIVFVNREQKTTQQVFSFVLNVS